MLKGDYAHAETGAAVADSGWDKVKSGVGTFFGGVLVIGFFLGVGWFIGFRPIEWVMDFVAITQSPDKSPRSFEPVAPAEPVEAPIPDSPPMPERWSCYWDPTMNEDWHDDVLCTRGYEYDRPILLADWGFVTQDDMMAAAADYEAWLNSQR
ncbi:hypothetical protein ACFUTX_05165 [Microbacterium sp. NPDC057407]|uniref:hypothetical protein n=1 Tax=Microbacterium sp. NPDC057407 TaxID=3346120 RepID=UPI00366AE810